MINKSTLDQSYKHSIVNHYKIHAFRDREQFLDQIKDEHKILVAMNAEK